MHYFKSQYGPRALVAGASEGLGAAFAEELAKKGLDLLLVARRKNELEALSKRLSSTHHIGVKYHPLDLADLDQTKHVISQFVTDLGLLVYNAAYSPLGRFEDIHEAELEKIVDVNIKAPLLLSRLVIPHMKERGRGGIILMSSLAGTQGSPGIAAYAASKAFNTILAEGIWRELKRQGIDVLACCAGAVSTPGYKKAQQSKDPPGTLDPETVVRQILNALGKGPVIVPGFTNKLALFFMQRILPRKYAISIMEKNTKNLF